METVCAFAPASIANLSVGFDVLGLALHELGDRVEVSLNHSGKNRITAIENGPALPYEIERNSCTVVIRKMQEALGLSGGVDVRIRKGFAAGSGLGSSSASSAAAAFAFNELAGRPYSTEELVHFAAEGERAACGSAHFDNVAAALLGGLVLIHDKRFIRLPVPEGLHVVSFLPMIRINTADSRSILNQSVPVHRMSQQVAHMGAFVASLYGNDLDLFSKSLQDLVIEPVRKLLIPRYEEMKSAAFQEKSLAFGISGSGPAVFALARKRQQADRISKALEKVYSRTGIHTASHVEELSSQGGARIDSFES